MNFTLVFVILLLAILEVFISHKIGVVDFIYKKFNRFGDIVRILYFISLGLVTGQILKMLLIFK